MTYQLTFTTSITRTADGALIPADPGNRDYQDYLAWVALGNTPTPYSPPATPVPASITNYQCRAVLTATASATAGKTLFDLVDAALKADGGLALQAWEHANEVTRSGALVASVTASLGLTSTQVDNLFITASGISA